MKKIPWECRMNWTAIRTNITKFLKSFREFLISVKGGYSIDNPIPEETLSKLQLNLQIPKGIYFDNEMYPVCLNYSKNKPYGDFTVYSGENSKVYHNDISCSGNPGKLMHLFDAINAGKRPCKRCVQCTNLPSTIPQWYIDIKKIQEFQLGKP